MSTLDFSELARFLDALPHRGGWPGSDCLVMLHGEPVFRHRTGFANLETGAPMTGRERVNLYSCSKIATCVAAMQLFEKGFFQLDDPLADYMPEFADMKVREEDGSTRPAREPIRIWHLFSMTAGFSYDLNSPSLAACRAANPACPTREFILALAGDPLHFDPGTRWNYSLCHDVLAALVEVLSGQSFADYTRDHIFAPLGMADTTFLLPDSELGTIAPQYRWNPEKRKPVFCGPAIQPYKAGAEYASGGAGCVSTCDDYAKLLEALRVGDVILKKETIDLMAIDRLTDATRPTFWNQEYGYGLGVRCKSAILSDGRRDFGWGGAAGSLSVIDREHGFTIMLVQHMLGATDPALRWKIVPLVREAVSAPRRQRDFLDMTWWDPYVETSSIADEDTYLRRKFRQNVTDTTTGLPQEALHDRLAEIVADGKAAGEDWRVTKAKCFAAEVNEESIDVSPLDWFPAIAIWDRLTLPIAKITKGDRARDVNAATLPEWVKEEWAAGNADGSWNMWQDFDHSVPDWRVILPLGFAGMKARLEQIAGMRAARRSAPTGRDGEGAVATQKSDPFYESCFIAADAILAGIDRFIAQGRKHLTRSSLRPQSRMDEKHTDLLTPIGVRENVSRVSGEQICVFNQETSRTSRTSREKRLASQIICLERLRDGAPQTAYDVMMFVWLYFMFSEHLDGIQCRSLTELDVFLTPYYDADLAAGRTTEAEFREQLKHFFWQWGSIANYWNQPVGLGGTKPDGTSEFNHVSKIILDVMDECALTTPKFLVKVAPNTPDWAWNKMLDMARRHRSIAFIGEEPTARALKKWTGASDQDCREMVVRGCYEFALRDGCNSTGVGHVNFLKIVEKMLAEAASCGDDAPSSQSGRDASCGDDAPSSQSSIRDDGGVVATAKAPLQGPFFPGSDGLAHANLTITKGNALPHWAANGVVYHICFRLADSVPQAKLREWEEARENFRRRLKDSEPLSENAIRELKNLQAATVEKYLDSGYGECLLSNRNVADILVAALMHDDGRQYLIHAYGIMPNHVHVLVEFPDSNDMGNAVRAWKSVSGHRTNKLLVRSGAVWQTDYYNHIIRTSKEYLHQKEYIFSNNMVASWKRDFRCGDDASSSQSSISDDGGVVATTAAGRDDGGVVATTAAGRDDGGVVATTAGWPSFLAEYLRRLADTTDRCRKIAFELEKVLPDVNPANLMTLATEHALRTRCDGFANGCPRGNNTAILSVGLGTAVDALLAVKELVFEKNEFTLAQLGAIMAANWEGHEALRLRMLRSKRKWGNNDPEANALGKELIECYSSQINGKPNSRGGVFLASGHCARQFIVLGEKTGATPDGRKAGEEMSKNLSPTMGADTEGATALVLTLASSDVEHLPGDYPLDMMLHPSVCAGDDGLAVMRTLVKLFHKNGGSVIQFTVFSPEELRDAQAHPEKYETLQVRVCGWNVRWNDLARPEQDAYIRRAENVAQTC